MGEETILEGILAGNEDRASHNTEEHHGRPWNGDSGRWNDNRMRLTQLQKVTFCTHIL